MNIANCWIPPLYLCEDYANWEKYEESLYKIFSRDWLADQPIYKGLPVQIRYNPRWGGREEGFWHLTCRDYGKEGKGPESRDPDIARCERIEWPKALIENYLLCGDCDDAACKGVLCWTVKAKNGYLRHKFLLVDERYLLVIEQRKTYYLLITAFKQEEEYSYRSSLREFERCSK